MQQTRRIITKAWRCDDQTSFPCRSYTMSAHSSGPTFATTSTLPSRIRRVGRTSSSPSTGALRRGSSCNSPLRPRCPEQVGVWKELEVLGKAFTIALSKSRCTSQSDDFCTFFWEKSNSTQLASADTDFKVKLSVVSKPIHTFLFRSDFECIPGLQSLLNTIVGIYETLLTSPKTSEF